MEGSWGSKLEAWGSVLRAHVIIEWEGCVVTDRAVGSVTRSLEVRDRRVCGVFIMWESRVRYYGAGVESLGVIAEWRGHCWVW